MLSSTALSLPEDLPPTRVCTSEDAKSGFECEQSALNTFFRDWALRHQNRGLSRTWVLPRPEGFLQLPPVLGYFTLTLSEVRTAEFYSAIRAKPKDTPRYEFVPVVLLARLARHIKVKGLKVRDLTLGQILLADAQFRALQINELAGGVAVIVDAKDDKAAAFYSKHSYQPLTSEKPLRMYYSMEDIRAAESMVP